MLLELFWNWQFQHLKTIEQLADAFKIVDENSMGLNNSFQRVYEFRKNRPDNINGQKAIEEMEKEARQAKDDLKEVTRYGSDQAKYDPTTEPFSDFLKNLKKIAKQALGNEFDRCIRLFLLGKLPVEIQRRQHSWWKNDVFTEEIPVPAGSSSSKSADAIQPSNSW